MPQRLYAKHLLILQNFINITLLFTQFGYNGLSVLQKPPKGTPKGRDGALLTIKSGRISFVITQDKSVILYHIQETFGFGNVRFDPGVQSYRFIVEDLPSLIKLAYLFNGNLFLDHRIKQ